jgi:hypothetical protein
MRDITRGCVISRGPEVVGGVADGEGGTVEDVVKGHRGAVVVVAEEFLKGGGSGFVGLITPA